MPAATPVKYKAHARIKKSADFELHIRSARAEGVEVLEIRDFVPSEKWYGRGIQIEHHLLPQVLEALKDYARLHGGSAHPQSTAAAEVAANAGLAPDQGRLFHD